METENRQRDVPYGMIFMLGGLWACPFVLRISFSERIDNMKIAEIILNLTEKINSQEGAFIWRKMLPSTAVPVRLEHRKPPRCPPTCNDG